jgi:hypothetical protein
MLLDRTSVFKFAERVVGVVSVVLAASVINGNDIRDSA